MPNAARCAAKPQSVAPTLRTDQRIVVNLSGRGDKDIYTVAALDGIQLF